MNAIMISFLMFGFGLYGQKEIIEQPIVESAHVVSVSKVSAETSTGLTEEDIYAREPIGDVMQVPLKATFIENGKLDYYLLSDGMGAMYVTMERLEDGENYIGMVTVKSDRLINAIKSDFTFTFEDYWEDEEAMHAERKVAFKLYHRKMTDL